MIENPPILESLFGATLIIGMLVYSFSQTPNKVAKKEQPKAGDAYRDYNHISYLIKNARSPLEISYCISLSYVFHDEHKSHADVDELFTELISCASKKERTFYVQPN
jgi:hypothetical protein